MANKAIRNPAFEEVAGTTIELSDSMLREVLQPPTVPVRPAAISTPRQINQREAEMARGRARIAEHVERAAYNPPPIKSAAERTAEGTSTPVFRPGDGGSLRLAAHIKGTHQVG